MSLPKPIACLLLLSLAACGRHLPTNIDEPPAEPVVVQPANPVTPPSQREHNARFVGLWAVEQPSHALYEVTYYSFESNGALVAGPSEPAGCTGHLARHCVTGSVANCPTIGCTSTVSCLFGSEWFSLDSSTLVIVGDCSDGVAREIKLTFNQDSSSNTGWGGGGAQLVSVGGETNWSHDNWDWAFRKCPAGTTETNCFP